MAATAAHSLTQNYMGNHIKYGQSLDGHKNYSLCSSETQVGFHSNTKLSIKPHMKTILKVFCETTVKMSVMFVT